MRVRNDRGSVADVVSSVAIVVGIAVAAHVLLGVDVFGYLADARDWIVAVIEQFGDGSPRHKQGAARNV